jgi:hypothetical protein
MKTSRFDIFAHHSLLRIQGHLLCLPDSRKNQITKLEVEINIMSIENNVRVTDDAHKAFYMEDTQKLISDVYLSSVTALEFLRAITLAFRLSPSCKKIDLINDTQGCIKPFAKDKHIDLVTILDEGLYLSAKFLSDGLRGEL